MSTRRDFVKSSLVFAAGIAAGAPLRAHATADLSKGIRGIIYTAENPGKWAKKVGGHAPRVTVEGKKVTITVKHSMSFKHYIVRHTLVSVDGTVLGEKTFFPQDEKPESTFELPEKHPTRLYATSFCNKHDFWLTEFSV
jgi:superoxide reductase